MLVAQNNAVSPACGQSPAASGSAAPSGSSPPSSAAIPPGRIRLRMSNHIDDLDPASQASDDLAVDTSHSITTATEAPGATVIEGDRMQVYLDRKMSAIG